jgi:hypothetical protein
MLITSSACWMPAVGQAYKLQFTNATAAKADGSVLVLDVGSLWQKHPADPPFGIATAAECQQRCAVLPGEVLARLGPGSDLSPLASSCTGRMYFLFQLHSAACESYPSTTQPLQRNY